MSVRAQPVWLAAALVVASVALVFVSPPQAQATSVASSALGAAQGVDDDVVLLLHELSVEDVHGLVSGWQLTALADCLKREEVDGDTLHHAEPDDFDSQDDVCPSVRRFHWRKFWRRLDGIRREGQTVFEVPIDALVRSRAAVEPSSVTNVQQEQQRQRRHLAGAEAAAEARSGLHIKSDLATIAIGAAGDVQLVYAGRQKANFSGAMHFVNNSALYLPGVGDVAAALQSLAKCRCSVASTVSDDVLLLLTFEDKTYVDGSDYDHDVSANGSAVSVVRRGVIGAYSLYLDSSEELNNYLTVEASSALELDGDFTIEAWVRFEDDSAHSQYYAYQDIIASENYACQSGESGSFVLRRVPSGMVEVRIYDMTGASSYAATVDTPDAAVPGQYMEYGVWHHVAFVRNGTVAASGDDGDDHNCRVYVNGTEWLSFPYV